MFIEATDVIVADGRVSFASVACATLARCGVAACRSEFLCRFQRSPPGFEY